MTRHNTTPTELAEQIAQAIENMSSPHAGDPFKVRTDAARIARSAVSDDPEHTGRYKGRRHNRCGLGDADTCGHPECPDMAYNAGLAARGNNTAHEADALSTTEAAVALRDAETLCRERHPDRWTTVIEQRTTCLACKETAIRTLRAALSPAPTNKDD